ncbi:uncharacterized protein LOC121605354 [Chelmon rostratus]|uniref:uncharacterized protein LOC121605354 n=1 Tax=Chelmon rostratus TaxID=109905 RepID=UPI001BEBB88E|nr:uncharacterized protein LOC121605354 [Chelmon rostratus]
MEASVSLIMCLNLCHGGIAGCSPVVGLTLDKSQTQIPFTKHFSSSAWISFNSLHVSCISLGLYCCTYSFITKPELVFDTESNRSTLCVAKPSCISLTNPKACTCYSLFFPCNGSKMMSKKIPQCSAVDPLEHDQPPSNCQVDRSVKAALGCRNKAESGQRNGETASSSPESGSLNGDGKRSGKNRRRKKRSSNPESRPEGKVDSKTKNEEKSDKRTSQPPDPRAGLIGLQSECANVWFERSVYERAESLYQCWLASSSNGTTQSNRSLSAPGKQSKSPSSVAASPSGLVCHHGDQVACHHVVQAVWVNKATFDQAERRFVEESVPSIPNSLALPSQPNRSIPPTTPDEGYQSLAQTPATPVIQQAAVPPTNRQPINGLPRIPVELLRDVWLEKPFYDRAEAAFYQNLYGNNSSKRSSCASTARSSDHPQSLVEEEEEEEEEDEEAVVEEKRVVPQGKAEVFHALLPIQEEEEPADVPEKEEASEAGVCNFVHPDNERVWLDKWRYDAAESRFHGYSGSEAVVVTKGRRPEAASVASTAPLRDKYDQTGRMEPLQLFHFYRSLVFFV